MDSNLPSFTDALPPAPNPAAPRRKKIIIVIGLVAVLVIVSLLIFAGSRWFRSSSDLSTVPSSSLPVSGSASPSPSASFGAFTAAPVASPASRSSDNLAIRLKYGAEGGFHLIITDIFRTGDAPTVQHFLPPADANYSVLRILGRSGEVLSSDNIYLPTRFFVDTFDTGGDAPLVGDQEQLIIVAISSPAGANSLVFTSADGQRQLAQQSFIFSNLLQTSAPAPKTSFWQRVFGALTAWAAAKPFVIAVINEHDTNPTYINAVAAEANKMATTLAPWTKFPVAVVPVSNTENLGCRTITGPFGRSYPLCANTGLIMSVVARRVPNWNAILVVTAEASGSGTVSGGGPVVALSRDASDRLISHELGHATGKLADEYMYKTDSDGIPGPNCFPSLNDCEMAITSFASYVPAPQCSLGCNTKTTYRPSSQIMHLTWNPLLYGAVEECLMLQKIAEAIGESADCFAPPPGASPTPDLYWGWRR